MNHTTTKHAEQSPLGHFVLSNIADVQLPHSALTDLSLLDAKAVGAIVGVKPGTLRQWVRAKTFPAPVRVSARCSRWAVGSVKAWLQFKLYERPGDTFVDPHAGQVESGINKLEAAQ